MKEEGMQSTGKEAEMEKNKSNKEIVADFFVDFALFEFAMKECGYLKVGKNCSAEPDWDKFSCDETLKTSLINKKKSEEAFRSAVEYYGENPAKKQIVIDNKPRFSDENKQITIDENGNWVKEIVFAIKRTRNNLFHGGKVPGKPMGDPQRDLELIKHGSEILKACLAAFPKMEQVFNEGHQHFHLLLDKSIS